MKCQACKQDMMIVGNKFTSAAGSTDVFAQLQTACRNPKCTEFAGNDLQKPKKSKKEKKVKVN